MEESWESDGFYKLKESKLQLVVHWREGSGVSAPEQSVFWTTKHDKMSSGGSWS